MLKQGARATTWQRQQKLWHRVGFDIGVPVCAAVCLSVCNYACICGHVAMCGCGCCMSVCSCVSECVQLRMYVWLCSYVWLLHECVPVCVVVCLCACGMRGMSHSHVALTEVPLKSVGSVPSPAPDSQNRAYAVRTSQLDFSYNST